MKILTTALAIILIVDLGFSWFTIVVAIVLLFGVDIDVRLENRADKLEDKAKHLENLNSSNNKKRGF